jgi:hypothetical protein
LVLTMVSPALFSGLGDFSSMSVGMFDVVPPPDPVCACAVVRVR